MQHRAPAASQPPPERLHAQSQVGVLSVRAAEPLVEPARTLVGVSGFLGPKTATTTAYASGYTVVATYPEVTRPGLPVRWEYTVRHAGGFDGPVTLAITFDYLDLFDLTNIEPEPTSASSGGDDVVYRFDPPTGDELRVSMDAAAESGFHEVPNTTTRVIVSGSTVVSVDLSTKVVP
ncbi:MAG: hypothetical protein ACXVQU_03730 [Actinomycetota bacterium]